MLLHEPVPIVTTELTQVETIKKSRNEFQCAAMYSWFMRAHNCGSSGIKFNRIQALDFLQ